MGFLSTSRLAVGLGLMSAAMLGSTVKAERAILLDGQNFSQTIPLSSEDDAQPRRLVVSIADAASVSGSVTKPFRARTMRNGFSGSFILDATAPDHSEFASHVAEFEAQQARKGLRLRVGLSESDIDEHADPAGAHQQTFELAESPFPENELAFVRFDVRQWEIAEGFLTYDIDVTYWGKQHTDGETVLAMHEAVTADTLPPQ